MLSDFQYCIQLMLKNQTNIKTHPKQFNDKYHDFHCTSPYALFITTQTVLGFNVAPGSPASVIAILAADLYGLVPTADALVVWRNRDVKACVKPFCRRMWNIFKHCTDQLYIFH